MNAEKLSIGAKKHLGPCRRHRGIGKKDPYHKIDQAVHLPFCLREAHVKCTVEMIDRPKQRGKILHNIGVKARDVRGHLRLKGLVLTRHGLCQGSHLKRDIALEGSVRFVDLGKILQHRLAKGHNGFRLERFILKHEVLAERLNLVIQPAKICGKVELHQRLPVDNLAEIVHKIAAQAREVRDNMRLERFVLACERSFEHTDGASYIVLKNTKIFVNSLAECLRAYVELGGDIVGKVAFRPGNVLFNPNNMCIERTAAPLFQRIDLSRKMVK